MTLLPWLRSNLGKRCLAALTGPDAKALSAAVQIIELYGYSDSRHRVAILEAFKNCVLAMQPSTRELAYHAIAHVMDWSDRQRVWTNAGLPALTPMRCSF